jgi:acyl-homoserine lactone acylase PvdQ
VRRPLAALAVGAVLASATLFLTWGLLFHRPLPTTDGYYRLLGLHERGEVVRDVFGIPRIYARDLHDLFFLQGYVTAQDRLAEMERTRAWARTVRIDTPTPIVPRGPSPNVALALEAYAEGVNKLIHQHAEARALPGELVLVGRRPRPWSADDSARIAMAHFEVGPGPSLCVTLDGNATRNGRPLLAADLWSGAPTRGWYEIGLSGGPVRAVGLSLPGVPGLLAGHNGWSAWAALPVRGADPYGAFVDILAAMVAQPPTGTDPPPDIACHTVRADVAAAERESAARISAALVGRRDLDLESLRRTLGRPAAGSGARLLIDMADVDTSRSAVSHGASAHPSSPHYGDQKALWEIGQTHRLPFTRGAIGRTDGELVLRAR